MFSSILVRLCFRKRHTSIIFEMFSSLGPKWQYVWKAMNHLGAMDETPYLTMQLGYKKTKGDFDKDIGIC